MNISINILSPLYIALTPALDFILFFMVNSTELSMKKVLLPQQPLPYPIVGHIYDRSEL